MTKENWQTTRIFCFLLFLIGTGIALLCFFTKVIAVVVCMLGAAYTLLWGLAGLWDFADELRFTHLSSRRVSEK